MKAGRCEYRLGGFFSALIITGMVATMSVLVAGPILAAEVSGDQAGTWTKASSPYIVTGNINIPAGQTLTMEPGVVVKFNDNLGIWVYGTLNADGTPEEKITFTSNGDLVPDWWRSIQFLDGSVGVLDHAIIRYGGYAEDANIVCSGNASPTISNSEISYSDVDGIRLYDNAHPTISNSTFSNNGHWPIHRWHQATPRLSGNTFTKNGYNGVYVSGHTIPKGAEVQWDHPGVPYVIEGTAIAAGGTLTIAAGTVIKLVDNVSMDVYGTLNAVGTASNKIVFTAYTDDTIGGDTNADGSETTPAGDYWRSIRFYENGGGTLDHTIIRYGGYAEDANITLFGNASPTISNSEISYSDVDGIRTYDAAQPTISNCTISHNGGWGIWRRHWNANPRLSGNTFSDNGYNGVYVSGHTIPAGQTVSWDHPGVPYVIEGTAIAAGGTLTIAAGTVIKLVDNVSMDVYGTLNAVGTASNKIVFTAYTDDTIGGDTNADGSETTPAGDYWRSIRFYENGGGTLDHAIIRYGGYAEDANITLFGNASPTISNSEISYSDVDGIRTYDAARPSIINSTITNNPQWPIRIRGWNAIADLRGCTIENNGWNGIYVDSHDIPPGQSVEWSVADVPYVIGHVRVLSGATLTIPAGMIVKFGRNEYITITGGATLNAVGTAERPIVFTAFTDDEFGGDTNTDGGNTVPGAGYWNSLYFDNGALGTLSHGVVRYGGYYERANMVCKGASPTISWTEIAYSSEDGLKLQDGAHPVLANNIITRNAGWPVYIVHFTAIPDFRNNLIRQNAHDGIYLNGGDVPAGQMVTLNRPTVPYVVGNNNIWVRAGATLNIPAGVIIKFTDDRYLQVDGGGTLSAKGTVDDRIVFTAYTDDHYGGDTNRDGPASVPVGDYWNSLYFSGGSRDTLDYCIIKYGGYSNDANIVFDGDASRAIVTNSIIAYSDGAGIRCTSNAQPTIVNNSLSPNEAYGIRVDGTFKVNATNNWWGDSTGPYHPTTNSNGRGMAVTDYVQFGPWLDAPPVVEPAPTVVEEPTGPLSYTIRLTPGLNVISAPLKPAMSHTAQSLLTMVEGTMIIAMEEGKFITYLPTFPGTGFSIEGGQGYIVNVPSGRAITFTGTGWSDGTSKPVGTSSELGSVWAFVVGGRLEGVPFDAHYTVVAKNLRTGAVVSDQVGSLYEGHFAAAWVDLNRGEVVRAGDRIEVVLKDPKGSLVAGPIVREVTVEDLQNAVLTLSLAHSQLAPSGFALRQNYPNPFNPETWIPYELAQEAYVAIRIYDGSGQLVRTLDIGQKRAGVYTAHWDRKNQAGQSVASGVYFYSMEAGHFSATRKMLMLR